jgi:hypothetical protein
MRRCFAVGGDTCPGETSADVGVDGVAVGVRQRRIAAHRLSFFGETSADVGQVSSLSGARREVVVDGGVAVVCADVVCANVAYDVPVLAVVIWRDERRCWTSVESIWRSTRCRPSIDLAACARWHCRCVRQCCLYDVMPARVVVRLQDSKIACWNTESTLRFTKRAI